MKAKDLAKKLLEHPEMDVFTCSREAGYDAAHEITFETIVRDEKPCRWEGDYRFDTEGKRSILL